MEEEENKVCSNICSWGLKYVNINHNSVIQLHGTVLWNSLLFSFDQKLPLEPAQQSALEVSPVFPEMFDGGETLRVALGLQSCYLDNEQTCTFIGYKWFLVCSVADNLLQCDFPNIMSPLNISFWQCSSISSYSNLSVFFFLSFSSNSSSIQCQLAENIFLLIKVSRECFFCFLCWLDGNVSPFSWSFQLYHCLASCRIKPAWRSVNLHLYHQNQLDITIHWAMKVLPPRRQEPLLAVVSSRSKVANVHLVHLT